MLFDLVFDYEYFKKEVYMLTGIDLNAYKENQMKRRIDTLIEKYRVDGYDKFVAKLKCDREVFDAFINYLTINVSEFYRDPAQWQIMEKQAIPALIQRFGKNLKIWSAACSTGDEPYSLVMAFSRHLPLEQINIMATDIDKQVIEKAKLGLYSEKSVAAVPFDLRKRYFTKIGSSYKISDEIKARVTFRQQNLLKDIYPDRCDMIVCRNVLIYFTEEAKDKIFRKYYASLKPGGILFIGSTEQVMNHKAIGYERKNACYYVRVQ